MFECTGARVNLGKDELDEEDGFECKACVDHCESIGLPTRGGSVSISIIVTAH